MQLNCYIQELLHPGKLFSRKYDYDPLFRALNFPRDIAMEDFRRHRDEVLATARNITSVLYKNIIIFSPVGRKYDVAELAALFYY